MKRLYSCDLKGGKPALLKILEAEPYADDSFARVGYIMREGKVLGEDAAKLYVFMNAADDFVKKADEKLKGVLSLTIVSGADEIRIITKIEEMENNAQSGLSLFD